jgi:hypothetical protein
MRYETFPIEGSAVPQFRQPGHDDVGDEITAVYNVAAKDGGRVVAAHNLVCDMETSGKDSDSEVARVDCLFLVVEWPDSTD